jgi:hypothetical protein
MVAALALLDRLWAEVPRTTAVSGTAENAAETSRPSKPAKEDETVQIAKLIDSVIQPRFLKEAGEFGLRRLTTSNLNGHTPVMFTAEDKTEKKVLEQVDASGRDYFLAFLHMAHKPGKYLRPPPVSGQPTAAEVQPQLTPIWTAKGRKRLSPSQGADLLKLATDRLGELRKGKDASASFEDFGVTLRPILARKSCLDCHAGAKEGETLGVMLYAVKKDAAKKSTNERDADSGR